MKKSTLLFSVIFFAALFFSSCANRNLTIEKRHYGKGYYVHTTGKRQIEKPVKTEAIALHETQPTSEKTEVAVNKSKDAAPVMAPASSEKKTGKTNKASAKNTSAKEVIAEPVRAVEKNSSVSEKTEAVRSVSKKGKIPSAASDEMLILIIILCFFLPPLAVYLSEGITTNFWIDLILTLLFWLPGVIFALIVCL